MSTHCFVGYLHTHEILSQVKQNNVEQQKQIDTKFKAVFECQN